MSETLEKNDQLSDENNINKGNALNQDEAPKDHKSYESSKYSHTQP